MSGENIKTACNQNMTLVEAINDDTVTVGYRNSITALADGDQTSTLTTKTMGAAPFAGTIVDIILSHGENGADGTDPHTATVDVFNGGTTCLATKPILDRTAGTGQETASVGVSGTGITAAVLHGTPANLAVLKGDVFTYTWTLTRTTPETEIADVCVTVVIEQETTDVVASQENKEQNVGEVFDFTSFHFYLATQAKTKASLTQF